MIRLNTFTATLALTLIGPALALAQPTVDGVIDAQYGSPVATDATGDGNASPVMDLTTLHLWHDTTALYIALSITGNIATTTTNWGKYVIYVDTTNDTSGAQSDAWGRKVVVQDPHKPEYSINTWVDQLPYDATRVQLWQWSGSWTQSTTGASAAALVGASQGSVIEIKLPLSALGSPQKIWVEAYSTGNGNTDNAQDTVNNPAEDFNATDWTTQAQLKVSTEYDLSGTSPDAGPLPDAGAPDSTLVGPEAGTPDQSVVADLAPTADQQPSSDTGPRPDGSTSDSAVADQGISEAGASDGPAADFGATADSGTTKTKQDEGCACAVGAEPDGASLALLLVGLALLGLGSRRRRRG